tara:strand:- start:215 stop:832 length:618 start_codon:yes stop_codon:yes gene_type:complete
MAFWGAPVKNIDHAFDAVMSAMEMRDTKDELNEELNEHGWPSINFGIGLHTGSVILGNIGSVRRLDYTIIGDNVNLGSRIEGLTKYYGCTILITEYTYQDIKTRILCRPIDVVQVKGKTKGIMIYEPLCLITDQTDRYSELAAITSEGFMYYQNQSWDKAIRCYEKIQSIQKNKILTTLIIERCQQYKTSPPGKNWTGIYEFTSK